MKQCPTCYTPIEKEAGCNFMTCRGVCKGKSYFCFICGEVLKVRDTQEQDHMNKGRHFPQGPYAEVCTVTMRGRQDVRTDK